MITSSMVVSTATKGNPAARSSWRVHILSYYLSNTTYLKSILT